MMTNLHLYLSNSFQPNTKHCTHYLKITWGTQNTSTEPKLQRMTKISKEKYAIQSLLSRVHMKDRSDKSFPLPYKQPLSSPQNSQSGMVTVTFLTDSHSFLRQPASRISKQENKGTRGERNALKLCRTFN